MTLSIPASIDDVTLDWLVAATGLSVATMDLEQIGVGVGVSSALYRAALEGDGCPQSVIIKLPALDEAAVFTSSILRMYIREVGFFRSLASESPIRVPKTFHSAVDLDTSKFVIVMEDFGDMRSVDQITGMNIGDAEHAIDELAKWHAKWWGEGLAMAESGATLSLNNPIYHAILPMVFAEGWTKLTEGLKLPESVLQIGEKWIGALPQMLEKLSTEPTTMVHGDFRADNMMFANDGSLALIDFQVVGTGTAAYDVAYFITQSLDADVAAGSERRLFDRWVTKLHEAGVSTDQTDRMWNDYRLAALFCLVYPVVASRGMDLDDPRQRALLECMSSRLGRAIAQLNLAELLD